MLNALALFLAAKNVSRGGTEPEVSDSVVLPWTGLTILKNVELLHMSAELCLNVSCFI